MNENIKNKDHKADPRRKPESTIQEKERKFNVSIGRKAMNPINATSEKSKPSKLTRKQGVRNALTIIT
jgi:hypothetical protein